MEQVICGASAFELYRIPPQVTLLLPEFPRFSTRRQRSAISRSNDLGPWLNLPIHTLCDSPSARTRSSAIKDHVWSGDLPSSAIWENIEVGVQYTSPLMTLLTLAPLVSVHRLTMHGRLRTLRDIHRLRAHQRNAARARPLAQSAPRMAGRMATSV